MITLYDPITELNILTNGNNSASQPLLLLNILIELRAMNAMIADINSMNDELDQLRKDVVSDTTLAQ